MTPEPPQSTLLIVEDDEDSRETLAEILRMEAFRVRAAGNGQEALDDLRREPPPDLILLDLMMPVMDGLQFQYALRLEAELSHIPILVISGDSNLAQEAERIHASGYLLKPIQIDRLLALVRKILA